MGATEAIATHCDLLVDRLAAQESVTADVAESFGQEIVRLRAEVLHLQTEVTSLTGDATVSRPAAVVVGCHWLDAPE